MDKDNIIDEIEEIKNLLTGLTSAVEEVKREVFYTRHNMDDNERVESTRY